MSALETALRQAQGADAAAQGTEVAAQGTEVAAQGADAAAQGGDAATHGADAAAQGGALRQAQGAAGATLWFTGLPSAGKSTIAHALATRLAETGARVQVLDGDEVRPHLSADLGYSRAARDVNVRRIGWVARLLASHGVVVLVPVIAPYAATRAEVRADHAAHGVAFAEVYVATPLAVAEQRDVKGLYARARRGEISQMTGVDDPYEPPPSPELVLDTTTTDVPAAVERGAALLGDLRGRMPA